jgi:hypothetical protein
MEPTVKAVTGIQIVYNETPDYLLFLKLENGVNNRFLEPNKGTSVGDCWVPWCSSHEDFLKKVIVIINRSKKSLVGFIWQDKDKDGDDRVRFGATGWDTASEKNRIPGYSSVDSKINLRINSKGEVSAEKA